MDRVDIIQLTRAYVGILLLAAYCVHSGLTDQWVIRQVILGGAG